MRTALLRLGVGLLGVAFFLLAVVVARGSGAEAPPPPKVAPISVSGPAVCFLGQKNAKQVRFYASASQPLDGATSGAGKVGIVLAHQADGNMCQWSDYADFLVSRGYRVLAFSFSSDAKPPADDASVVAAARTLKQLGATKIVLVGASRGGAAVLAAAGKLRVNAVAALSPPSSYNGSDAYAGVGASRAPLLIAAGQLDGSFPMDASLLYRHAAAKSKKLIIRKGSAAHGVALLEFRPKALVDKALLDLLAKVRRG